MKVAARVRVLAYQPTLLRPFPHSTQPSDARPSMNQTRSFWWTRAREDIQPDGTHKRPTCGLLVIGDEILNGSTKDTNSQYLCDKLHERGVAVQRITTIGDRVNEIADQIRLFSSKYDVVLTTGGIGPTHDDRTFEGLGLAFDEELQVNQELFKVVEVFLKKTTLKNVDAAVEKFCKIPKSASLLWGESRRPSSAEEMTRFPSVLLRNVVCFPGVPKFCQLAYDQLEDTIFPRDLISAFFNKSVYLKRNEVYLQEEMCRIAQLFKDSDASIGSYPTMDNNYFKTKLVVESTNPDHGQAAYNMLRNAFSEYIVNYDEQPWTDANTKLEAFMNGIKDTDRFFGHLANAIKVIDQILDQFSKYGPGKPIQAFHILCGDEFSEMADFIRDAGRKYNLDTQELNGPMREGLEILVARKPAVKAVLMGSRFTDPNGRFMKSECQWTDPGWPHLYRVCPVLWWHYVDVWHLLRSLYKPAYELHEDALERAGRENGGSPIL